ncbi:hypothetical protein C8J56DRAFT_980482 [Mycena floridula]|nr:hypothetical protein C8J56DRAFT_980482 [Mycena floridula]
MSSWSTSIGSISRAVKPTILALAQTSIFLLSLNLFVQTDFMNTSTFSLLGSEPHPAVISVSFPSSLIQSVTPVSCNAQRSARHAIALLSSKERIRQSREHREPHFPCIFHGASVSRLLDGSREFITSHQQPVVRVWAKVDVFGDDGKTIQVN